MQDMSNKIALITGAARGQGRSHAIRLAEAGASIIAFDICAPVEGIDYAMASEEDLAETAELVRATGARIITDRVDVRNFGKMASALDDAVSKLGGLDVVVTNAGVLSMERATEITQSIWDTIIAINLTGTQKTVRAALPHLVRRGGGSIVSIASVAGLAGLPFLDAYVASKHGIVGLVRALAIELADRNIRVNAICPTGVADTGMQLGLREDILAEASEKLQFTFKNAFKNDLIEKSDVSAAVLYLASDSARSITGSALAVDAGLLAL